MTEENSTNPQPEEVAEVEQEAQDVPETEDYEEPEEEIEVSFAANPVKLPRDLPPEVVERVKEIAKSLDTGFTQKTQSVAEERRAIEQARAQIAAQAQAAQVAVQEIAQLKSIDTQLDAYAKVDWQTFADQDPTAAQKHFMQYTALQNKRAETQRVMESKQQHFVSQQQAATEALLSRGRQVLSEKIPEWGETKQQQLAQHSQKAYGFRPDELAYVMDPRVVLMMNDAYLYRQSIQKATAKPAAPQPEPVQKVGGTASVAKSPDKMSMTEWLEMRERQLRRKNR